MSKLKITSFGEHIRGLREKAGLPLRKVAAQLNMDPSLLGKIERNERNPTKEHIRKLAAIFRQDQNFLLSKNLSDQIAYKIFEENADVEILKVAEEKLEYLKKNSKRRQYDKKQCI
jgi:transcriptional regulator with XRE-family HTH domain